MCQPSSKQHLVEVMRIMLDSVIEITSAADTLGVEDKSSKYPDPGIKTFLALESISKNVKSLLENLRECVASAKSVSDVLERLPLTGQLLGRLCGIPQVLNKPDVYRLLLACILTFYQNRTPDTPLEVKAKNWALSQVRSTVSAPSGHDIIPLCLMGLEQKTVCHHHTKQVVHEMVESIKTDQKKRTKSCVSSTYKLSTSLLGNVDLMLHMVSHPELTPLAETLLQEVSSQPISKELLQLYDRLTDIQQNCPGSTVSLSYKAQILLWLNHLPSLELAVLDLVKTSVTQSDTHSFHGMVTRIQDCYLCRGCAEFPRVYTAVIQMLHEIVRQTDASWAVVQFVGNFLSTVRQKLRDSAGQLKHVSPLCEMYPADLHQLVNILQVSPQDLTDESVLASLQLISESISLLQDSLSHMTYCEVWMCSIHFPDWYKMAIEKSLQVDKTVVRCCVDIIMRFKYPTLLNNHNPIKEGIEQMIYMFQGLLGKSNLKAEDIEYAVSTNRIRSENSAATAVIGQLLLLFLFLSKGGLRIGEDILTMACQSDNKQVQLMYLVKTWTDFTVGQRAVHAWSLSKRGELCSLLSRLKVQCENQTDTNTKLDDNTRELFTQVDKILSDVT